MPEAQAESLWHMARSISRLPRKIAERLMYETAIRAEAMADYNDYREEAERGKEDGLNR